MRVAVSVNDLRQWPEAERSIYAEQLARVQALTPFDLTQDTLLRVGLLQLGERDSLLITTWHHMIMDGWSLGIFAHKLVVLYDGYRSGGTVPLPDLPVQYGDFAYWQRQWCCSAARDEPLAYWQKQL